MPRHTVAGQRHKQNLRPFETDRYEPQPDQDAQLRQDLIELPRQKPRFGYRRSGVLLERRGHKVNAKRLYRIYREEHLAVRRLKRKHVARPAAPLANLSKANQEWSMDSW
ncbi:MAG: IS3 family transposase [Acidobacteriota bacterium]